MFFVMSSANITVLRGVEFCTPLLLRLIADRVMSCNCRPELESVDDPCVEGRGVKKRVNRFGVMGGGFRIRLLVDAEGIGGDELKQSDRGSIGALRAAQGEDISARKDRYYTQAIEAPRRRERAKNLITIEGKAVVRKDGTNIKVKRLEWRTGPHHETRRKSRPAPALSGSTALSSVGAPHRFPEQPQPPSPLFFLPSLRVCRNFLGAPRSPA